MDVLDERLDLLADGALAHGAVLAAVLVASQRLPQHRDERPIPRQEHGSCLAVVATPGGNVQADERLARAGNARHEDDGLIVLRARPLDDLLDRA